MRLKPGDTVTLEGFGLCVVMDVSDPALTVLKLPSGRVVRMGNQTVERLRIDELADARTQVRNIEGSQAC